MNPIAKGANAELALRDRQFGPTAESRARLELRHLAAALNSRAALFLCATFITLTFVTFPRLTLVTDVESAWSAVLGYAHQVGLQFGRDIVYPYGPLGFLLVPHFLPGTGVGRLAFDLALCFGVSSGVCLLAWRCRPVWRLLLVILFALLAANKTSGLQDLLFDLGLLTWGLVCFTERTRRAYLLVLLSFAIIGSLAKITFLAGSVLTIAIVTLNLFLAGRRWLALALATAYPAGVLTVWVLLGQQLSDFLLFATRALVICGGYDEAMALDPPNLVLAGGILTVLCAVSVAALRCAGGSASRGRSRLLLVWLLGCMFLAWKHGFVRADLHHTYLFFAFATVFVLALEGVPLPQAKLRPWVYVATALGCVAAITTLLIALFPKSLQLDRCFAQVMANAQLLLRPQAYFSEMSQSLSQEQGRVELPGIRRVVGGEGLDSFGNYQVYAALGGFNFRPRPVFQSYAVYSRPLMELNEKFYFSTNSPLFVLATLRAIDHRFPPLEDATLLRTLILNYRLADTERGFLLLKRLETAPPQLTEISKGIIHAGDAIDLKSFGDSNLWLEAQIEPTLLGRLQEFLYHSPKPVLRLLSGTQAQQAEEFGAPAPMLAAGFVVSPLLTSQGDLLAFCSGQPVRRPASCSIKLGAWATWLCKPQIHYRVFRIEPGPSNWRADLSPQKATRTP